MVWQVLQALRSHDDRFDAMINRVDLEGADKSKLEVIAVKGDPENLKRKMEVVAVTDKVQRKTKGGAGAKIKKGKGNIIGKGTGATSGDTGQQLALHYEPGAFERAIYAKVVEKCGNRSHWEDWAVDIAKIAKTHISRIKSILAEPENVKERKAFEEFAVELRDDLNGSISDEEIIEMLAQHLITKPVFDALFKDYSFASKNPMSLAMQDVIDVLQEHNLAKEADTLTKFYDSVRIRAEGINSSEGKQKIILELYDKFFSKAFPKTQQALGIVYTPVEVVDFIIHSVNDVLQSEFNATLGTPGIHIIDPFTGTGTFITRLLQSGLMTPEQIKKKFPTEIHANELVLLAYYIAAINIESVYHGIVGGEYVPFNGICLTDTFQMYEQDDLVDAILVENSSRRKRQKKLDIRVIIGNPPYSAGQDSANDNNGNVSYPDLDRKIALSYAARSGATNKNALYDSYIRAIKWASGRIGDSGVIGFVTNGGYLEANTADGLRKCLAEEFSSIYVFHLRGNARTSGELRRKEKDNVFGVGSRAPIAISILVKNPKAKDQGRILFRDIGDYLTREEKLEIIDDFTSINGITEADGWTVITPDDHGDWLRQRDDSFSQFIVMGDKEKGSKQPVIFASYSAGVKTQRDAWCYNASKPKLLSNLARTIDTYNSERQRYQKLVADIAIKEKWPDIDGVVTSEPKLISWTRALKADATRNKPLSFNTEKAVISLYRPFTKLWLYFDRRMNEMVYQMPKIFPDSASENMVIMVKQRCEADTQFALMLNIIPELQTDGGAQCFPLYLYDEEEPTPASAQGDIFGQAAKPQRKRRDAITDEGLQHFKDAYPGESITKHDLFYYIYGLLHSPQYRERFADNLSKELPRIPRVKTATAFWAFSKAGYDLAQLHLNYETVKPYEGVTLKTPASLISSDYRVEKMRFGKDKDRTTIIYNPKITVTGIPLEAYDYVVNGRSPIEWVMDRQLVKTDKDSGIVNDANDWAIETMNNPRYPLDLLLRVITVSLETQKIVNALPSLDFYTEETSK